MDQAGILPSGFPAAFHSLDLSDFECQVIPKEQWEEIIQVIEPNELVLTAEFLDLLAPPPASDWPAVQSHPMDQYKNAASDTAEAGAQDQSSTSESKSSSSSSASSADADSDAVADDVDPAADAEVVLEQCNIFYQEFVRQALPTINRVLPTLGYGVASRIEREDASSISSSSSTSASPGPVGTKTVLSLRGRKGQLSVGEVHALVQEIDGMLARPGIFEFEELFQRSIRGAAAVLSSLVPRAVAEDLSGSSATSADFKSTSSSSSSTTTTTTTTTTPTTSASSSSFVSDPQTLWSKLSRVVARPMAISGEDFLVPYETGFEANMADSSVAFPPFDQLTDAHVAHMAPGYGSRTRGRLLRRFLLALIRAPCHEMIHCVQHVAKQVDNSGRCGGASWSAEHDASLPAHTIFWQMYRYAVGADALPADIEDVVTDDADGKADGDVTRDKPKGEAEVDAEGGGLDADMLELGYNFSIRNSSQEAILEMKSVLAGGIAALALARCHVFSERALKVLSEKDQEAFCEWRESFGLSYPQLSEKHHGRFKELLAQDAFRVGQLHLMRQLGALFKDRTGDVHQLGKPKGADLAQLTRPASQQFSFVDFAAKATSPARQPDEWEALRQSVWTDAAAVAEEPTSAD